MNKTVLFSSSALGDTIAWLPYVEEYRKLNDVKVTLGCHFFEYFQDHYPLIDFVEPDQIKSNGVDFEIGFHWLKNKDGSLRPNLNVHPNDYRLIPLQQLAADILDVPFREIRPLIKPKHEKPTIQGKYVCIAVQSTLQCKYWNNPDGWQGVVNYLKRNGYEVVLIDKYRSFGSKKYDYWNYAPHGVIDKTNLDLDLWDRIHDLYFCDFFIGLGSGLSWLSWAVGSHCFLISGFSKPFCEFQSNVTRIHNQSVCNGCFNDVSIPHNYDDWMWCPRFQNTDRAFECTTSITSQDVINKIDLFLKKNKCTKYCNDMGNSSS